MRTHTCFKRLKIIADYHSPSIPEQYNSSTKEKEMASAD